MSVNFCLTLPLTSTLTTTLTPTHTPTYTSTTPALGNRQAERAISRSAWQESEAQFPDRASGSSGIGARSSPSTWLRNTPSRQAPFGVPPGARHGLSWSAVELPREAMDFDSVLAGLRQSVEQAEPQCSTCRDSSGVAGAMMGVGR